MAYSFNGSNQYLSSSGAVLSSVPITMGCWFYSTSNSAKQRLISIGDKDSTSDFFHVSAMGNVTGDPLRASAKRGGATGTATTSSGYSINTWHHAAAVFISNSSRKVYLDAGSVGSNTTSATPASLDTTRLGLRASSGTDGPMAGRIAEAGIWNIALTANDIAQLAEGFSPLLVRPDALVAYWPLGGIARFSASSAAADYAGGSSMLPTNTPTEASHPEAYYPSSPTLHIPAAVVPAAPGQGHDWAMPDNTPDYRIGDNDAAFAIPRSNVDWRIENDGT